MRFMELLNWQNSILLFFKMILVLVLAVWIPGRLAVKVFSS